MEEFSIERGTISEEDWNQMSASVHTALMFLFQQNQCLENRCCNHELEVQRLKAKIERLKRCRDGGHQFMQNSDINPTDILVTVAHPFGDIEMSLKKWIRIGPGLRPLVAPISARDRKTGNPLPIDVIPIQYRNNSESLRRVANGEFEDPWGRTREQISALIGEAEHCSVMTNNEYQIPLRIS